MRFIKRLREIKKNVKSLRGFAFDEKEPWQIYFRKIWPVLDAVLESVELLIRKEKAQDVINKIQIVGDKLASGQTDEKASQEFLKEFVKIWAQAKLFLNIVKIFTGRKTDKVIDKIIHYGNHLTKQLH